MRRKSTSRFSPSGTAEVVARMGELLKIISKSGEISIYELAKKYRKENKESTYAKVKWAVSKLAAGKRISVRRDSSSTSPLGKILCKEVKK